MAKKRKESNENVKNNEQGIQLQNNTNIISDSISKQTQNNDQYGKKYYDEALKSGLDYSAKGMWQKMYAKFIDTVFGIKNKTVLDLGCAMGAISSAFADYRAIVTGVDISEYMITNSPFKNLKLICSPCWNLKEIADKSIDFVHSHYLLNLVPDDKIDLTFSEINRVLKNNGIFFSILHFQGDKLKDFWDKKAQIFNFEDQTKEYQRYMFRCSVPGWKFVKYYRWQFFVYKHMI